MSITDRIRQSYLMRNLLYMTLTLIGLFILLWIGLRLYTSHGQKLILPDFQGMNIEEARKIAKKSDFEIFIDDSIHIVGKPGGEILDQNPKPQSGVKEGRKVYVTTSKHVADVFLSSQLPPLYGRKYEYKAKELNTLFQLDCKIEGYSFDPGPPNHILEVRYKGKSIENSKGRNKRVEIAKGDELLFILSKRDGGLVSIPNLVCETVESAQFMAQTSRLTIGDIIDETGEVINQSEAFVYAQDPKPGSTKKVTMGSAIKIYIQRTTPPDCP